MLDVEVHCTHVTHAFFHMLYMSNHHSVMPTCMLHLQLAITDSCVACLISLDPASFAQVTWSAMIANGIGGPTLRGPDAFEKEQGKEA